MTSKTKNNRNALCRKKNTKNLYNIHVPSPNEKARKNTPGTTVMEKYVAWYRNGCMSNAVNLNLALLTRPRSQPAPLVSLTRKIRLWQEAKAERYNSTAMEALRPTTSCMIDCWRAYWMWGNYRRRRHIYFVAIIKVVSDEHCGRYDERIRASIQMHCALI